MKLTSLLVLACVVVASASELEKTSKKGARKASKYKLLAFPKHLVVDKRDELEEERRKIVSIPQSTCCISKKMGAAIAISVLLVGLVVKYGHDMATNSGIAECELALETFSASRSGSISDVAVAGGLAFAMCTIGIYEQSTAYVHGAIKRLKQRKLSGF